MPETKSLMQWGQTAVLLLVVAMPTEAQGPRVLGDAVRELGKGVATKAKEGQKKRIAVLPFKELDGRSTVLGTLVSEKLVTALFDAGGLEIVERTTLDKVIEQIRFDRTGFIDQESAKKVGTLAGADAIVTGTIADLATYLDVNCRLIDARTGGVFAAAGVEITKDDNVKKALEKDLAGPGGGEKVADAQGKTDARDESWREKRAVAKVLREQDFVFELRGCAVTGSKVVCDLLVTNEGADRNLSFWCFKSRLFDGEGNETRCIEVAIGSSRDNYSVGVLVASRVPVKAQVQLADPAGGAPLARLVEIAGASSEGDFRLQFRDVPLARR